MDLADFDFELPPELIAQDPPSTRGHSRLLVAHRSTGSWEDSAFERLPDHLRAGDLLVVNDTKVFPARLIGRREPSGGVVECLLLRQRPDGSSLWEALVHPGQKLKPGARMVFERDGVTLRGEVLDRHFHGRRTVRLWSDTNTNVMDAVERIGHIPLPPYIKREDGPLDRERYQTVYARAGGSIAAPTAGLHFTPAILEALTQRGIERTEVTLHVGYGTFKPIRVNCVEDHVVDPESYEIGPAAAEAISRARREGRRVIAVGTTTVRVLESLAFGPQGDIEATAGETGLFIRPGHQFRVVDGLVTNFHLPRSSLFVLVSVFAGQPFVRDAYRAAVERRYRFYSYGDAMLIL